MEKVQISIIIVHYKADKEFFACIHSLIRYPPHVLYQVIVIDNDESPTLEKKLLSLIPTVDYITNPNNTGFGAGNNLGARAAKGKYLFFLNPDTLLYPNSIDALCSYLNKNSLVGAVSPILIDRNENIYPLQGTKTLTPSNGIVVLSFLNKIFPNNPISNDYWLKNKDKNIEREVEVLPGTACMIRKNIYENVGGFDEKFFLYFEEFDLCKRLHDKQYKMYSIPESKVMHLWGKSTEGRDDITSIFLQSRKYYFSKHYGLIASFIVELFANFNKICLLLISIISIGIFLLFFRLNTLMPFIGDQAWFYISARDMIIHQWIPLVGITSSHTWLHQGPLWTYILAGIFLLTNFNPLAPGYVSALLSVLAIYFVYKIGSNMFTMTTGLIGAFLFATSPLVIVTARMPFCISPIPLFVLLFIFSLYKLVKNHKFAFPACIFLLGVLYNLEIATSIFAFIFLIVLTYRFITKKNSRKIIYSHQMAFLSLLGLIPMIPMVIYDTSHGYPQTIKFAAWFILHIISIIIPIRKFAEPTSTYPQMYSFVEISLQKMLFIPYEKIGILLFLFSTMYLVYVIYKNWKSKQSNVASTIVFLTTYIPLLALIASKTPSDAYLPMLYPGIILTVSILLQKIYSVNKFTKIVTILLVVTLGLWNGYSLISHNYYMQQKNGYGLTFNSRQHAANQILLLANNKPFILKASGPGSKFVSFSLNYSYLTWYTIRKESTTPHTQTITIYDDGQSYKIF